MKKVIDWKLFTILLISSIITVGMVLPYTFALSPSLAHIFTPVVYAAQFIQSFVLFSIAIFFGLLLSKRVGFGLPVFEGRKPVRYLISISGISVGMGLLAGILVIAFSLFFSTSSLSLITAEMSIPAWKGLLASFYGGFAEEILFRFFLMTLFVWISTKVTGMPDKRPTAIGIWMAIVLTSVLFGLGHLGITGSITVITPVVVLRAVLLNGVAGTIFGWLYWKYGLESAIIAHFSADIMIHVITPLAASIFINNV